MERKAKNGYLNSRLGVDGYSPDALMKNSDGWVNPAGRTPSKGEKVRSGECVRSEAMNRCEYPGD